ncbi:unnamed protein product, partial [Prorocentrum cordatum]
VAGAKFGFGIEGGSVKAQIVRLHGGPSGAEWPDALVARMPCMRVELPDLWLHFRVKVRVAYKFAKALQGAREPGGWHLAAI